MSSGWGCQYLTKKDELDSWCRRLNHPCQAGCKGCVLYSMGIFSGATIPQDETKKRKIRSDNLLKK